MIAMVRYFEERVEAEDMVASGVVLRVEEKGYLGLHTYHTIGLVGTVGAAAAQGDRDCVYRYHSHTKGTSAQTYELICLITALP